MDLPVWGIVAIVIGTVLLSIVASISGQNIMISRGGLQIGGKRRRRNPHTDCPHVKDVAKVFRNRDDLRAQIVHIETHKMPKEIMQSAEDAVERILGIMESQYLSLLKNLNIAEKRDVASLKEFKNYRVILRAIEPKLISECRRMMNENGWIKKELDGTFDTYSKNKINDFISYVTKLLDDYYLIDNPTRVELFDYNIAQLRVSGGVHDVIESTIKNFLIIAKNWQKEIDVLSAVMDREMNDLIGG